MQTPFVSDSFDIPKTYQSELFYFTPLVPSVSESDYEAVMSSLVRLKGLFGPDSPWPSKEMTLAENTASLQVHEAEFESREAFAYAVFDQSKRKCLGSVYIDPSKLPGFDCAVCLWVREDSASLDQALYNTVVDWLTNDWSFTQIAFPGRDVSWEDY